jgi:NAD(P)-dependent dehydrogenase (short-subunit alcohol dehydrogenase family)
MSGSRVALVTGGGTGIGKATALALASRGHSVIVTGRRQGELDEVVRQGQGMGQAVQGISADVADPRSVAALFSVIRERFHRLDLLFNNAGQSGGSESVENVSIQDWNATVGTNLTGAFLCTQHAFRIMKEQSPKGGRIINNGSISASVPRPHSVCYTATKHGISGLTKSTSLDGRPFDIACGQIDIGNAATQMTAAYGNGALQADGSVATEPRMSVDHVVEAVLYMANLPLDANVQSITVMATKMPYIGRG